MTTPRKTSDVKPKPLTVSLGQVAYEAYCTSTKWKSLVYGGDLPQWPEVEPNIKRSWEIAGRAVVEAYEKTWGPLRGHKKPEVRKPLRVHREPEDFKHDSAENCADCHEPTRFWLEDGHTPLCKACCEKRNQL